MRNPDPFRYPSAPHVRRHGPRYGSYSSYRDWLRDEFRFRCVFCLEREQWTQVRGRFDLDHCIPWILRPDLEVTYDNLLYTCHGCNLQKSSKLIPDPAVHAYGKCLEVVDSGEMRALNESGVILIDALDLNRATVVENRKMWIDVIRGLAGKPDLLSRLMGLPNHLPELKSPRTGNSRPDGLKETWLERRNAGLVPPILE